uniref:Uncharacterized protein n=1 Tax=Panagrolaimus sp. PS1159 TaxID=55785 RepID=A0AC35GPY3_9BILA
MMHFGILLVMLNINQQKKTKNVKMIIALKLYAKKGINLATTKEDKKCEDDNNIEALCKEGDQSCEDIKKRLDCIKKTSMEKCENEKLAQFRVDAYTYTVQKILPNCNV